ncbi:two-component system regulatory protein YycI [Exiguobacterium sp. B2(2022)]|uniref:two-component system regulatory protein YycI n=1 Tax=Exiguobacterium sp. B2(2022) TaxID=2992755 RepID=UPI00237AB308|nr:two-component system regulatory protein YycI [Exiguobacterium sp. B2(2022)]MDE0562909.1 two-component system regulatory protein YycI [Exiguobacterium sp. B2(2022)]
MDWSKAKTILIFAFLALNIYLLFQLVTETWATEVVTNDNTSIAQILDQRNVDPAKLPRMGRDIGYLTGSSEEMSAAMITKNREAQLATTLDNMQLEVELKQPVPLDAKDLRTTASTFVAEYVPFGEEYDYWRYDEKTRQIAFVQTFEDNKIFSAPEVEGDSEMYIGPSLILIQLNEEYEVTDYKQRHLKDISSKPQDDLVLTASEAISQLASRKYFQPNQEMRAINTGFYSLPLDSSGGLIIMPPLWSVAIDDHVYFVNAIDGTVERVEFETKE